MAFVQERITGRLTQFQYDSGLISQIQDPDRHITTFTVSGGNLTEIIFPDETGIQLVYEGSLLTQWINTPQTDEVTSFTYDYCARVTSITTPKTRQRHLIIRAIRNV